MTKSRPKCVCLCAWVIFTRNFQGFHSIQQSNVLMSVCVRSIYNPSFIIFLLWLKWVVYLFANFNDITWEHLNLSDLSLGWDISFACLRLSHSWVMKYTTHLHLHFFLWDSRNKELQKTFNCDRVNLGLITQLGMFFHFLTMQRNSCFRPCDVNFIETEETDNTFFCAGHLNESNIHCECESKVASLFCWGCVEQTSQVLDGPWSTWQETLSLHKGRTYCCIAQSSTIVAPCHQGRAWPFFASFFQLASPFLPTSHEQALLFWHPHYAL